MSIEVEGELEPLTADEEKQMAHEEWTPEMREVYAVMKKATLCMVKPNVTADEKRAIQQEAVDILRALHKPEGN